MIPIADEEKAKRFPFINISIILINIYVFYLQLTAADPVGFIYQYALIPANVNFADITTLSPFITSMFLHGGFLHIISNMIFLWVFGDNVEGYLPPFVYLFFYIGAGIVGGAAQYMIMPDSEIPMLGASGAVAGALGAYFILFPHNTVKALVILPFFITIIKVSAALMLGYWIVLQIVAGFDIIGGNLGQQGSVAYLAHIGGFVAGIILIALFPRKKVQGT